MALDPKTIYVAWRSFPVADVPGVPGTTVVTEGMRLRGDDPIAMHAPHNFVPDGAPSSEIAKRIAEHYAGDWIDLLFAIDEARHADPEARHADLEARVAELERALELRDPERLVGTAEASRNYSVSQDELRRHPARYGGRKLGGRWKFPATPLEYKAPAPRLRDEDAAGSVELAPDP